MKEYVLTNTFYDTDEKHTFYGIALVDKDGGMYELIEEYNGLSEDKNVVQELVDNCNSLKVEESQLIDAVEDFMTKYY